jgi:predicted ATP-grasp superfamily ATP-dependent carboligase
MSPALTRQWQHIGEAVVRYAGLRGIFGIDAIISTSEAATVVWPIEVNPRYTASVEVLERALNFSSLAAHVRVWSTQPEREDMAINSRTARSWFYGKRILYALDPVTFAGSVHDSLMAWQADQRTRQIADRPTWGTEIGAQAPICTLIACAEDPAEVETALGLYPRPAACEAILF